MLSNKQASTQENEAGKQPGRQAGRQLKKNILN